MNEIVLAVIMLAFAVIGWMVRHLNILNPIEDAFVAKLESYAVGKAEAAIPGSEAVVNVVESPAVAKAAEVTLADLLQKHMDMVSTAKDAFTQAMATHAGVAASLKELSK